MSTIRVARRTRYTSVDRSTINDDRLSFRARGILVWLLDKPDDWSCRADSIATAGKEGRDAVRAALRELEAAGYLVRGKKRDPKTQQWVSHATVYEVPQEAESCPQAGDGFPVVGSPVVGAPGPSKKTENRRLKHPLVPHYVTPVFDYYTPPSYDDVADPQVVEEAIASIKARAASRALEDDE